MSDNHELQLMIYWLMSAISWLVLSVLLLIAGYQFNDLLLIFVAYCLMFLGVVYHLPDRAIMLVDLKIAYLFFYFGAFLFLVTWLVQDYINEPSDQIKALILWLIMLLGGQLRLRLLRRLQ